MYIDIQCTLEISSGALYIGVHLFFGIAAPGSNASH
jgi:hypothetical protein